MYVLSQRHPVWVTETHVNPCNSVDTRTKDSRQRSNFKLSVSDFVSVSASLGEAGGKGGGRECYCECVTVEIVSCVCIPVQWVFYISHGHSVAMSSHLNSYSKYPQATENGYKLLL